MNADTFTRRWLGLLALLAVLVVIAPYFIHVVVQNAGCHETAGACARMDEALTLYGRRVILAVFLVPLLIALAARTLTIGAFIWAFPFALVMLAGAAPLFFEVAAFAADRRHPLAVMEAAAFMPALFLILLLVALSAYPEDREGGTAPAWRAALGFVALAALFVTAPAWLEGLDQVPWLGPAAWPMHGVIAQAHAALGIEAQLPQFATYCLIAFVLGAAGLVISRGGGEVTGRRTIRVMRA
jgi:hypothetical protein